MNVNRLSLANSRLYGTDHRHLQVAAFLIFLFSTQGLRAQSAKDYYDELYKAGGLDRMSDGYVCFDDDKALNTFFIFGKSSTIKSFLVNTGHYKTLAPGERKLLDKGFLSVKQYDKGVPLGERDTYEADSDGWVLNGLPLDHQTKLKIMLMISWQTLRYKKTVDVSTKGGPYTAAASRYGRCEEVSPEIAQKGD